MGYRVSTNVGIRLSMIPTNGSVSGASGLSPCRAGAE